MKADIDINYKTGVIIVTNAINKDGTEHKADSVRHSLRRKLLREGFDLGSAAIFNETDRLVEWIGRATRQKFDKPKGEFVYRLVDSSDPDRFERVELTQWPQK